MDCRLVELDRTGHGRTVSELFPSSDDTGCSIDREPNV